MQRACNAVLDQKGEGKRKSYTHVCACPRARLSLSLSQSLFPLGSIVGCLRVGTSEAAGKMRDHVKVIYLEVSLGTNGGERGLRKEGVGMYQARSHRVALGDTGGHTSEVSLSDRDEQGAGAVYTPIGVIRATPTVLLRTESPSPF